MSLKQLTLIKLFLSSVTSRLKDVNADVLNNNGHINTTTKEINYANNISSRALASHQKNTFWWGSPSHFRTNAAAKNFTYQLKSCIPNTGLTILGDCFRHGYWRGCSWRSCSICK